MNNQKLKIKRVTTLPGRSRPGKTKNDLSWRCFKAGFWTFIKPLAFLLFFFSIYSLDAQTNIKGLAPMLEPKGGLAVDGNAFVNSP
ncbi:MAG: hypothetical protein KJO51_03355, partial [Gramella sp.]|nr:hypothetical protein [Christiangramia sp.]